MSLALRFALSVAAAAIIPSAAAIAADYDPPMLIDNAEEYVPVEVGSGWYIRGDLDYAFSREYDNSQFGVTSEFAPFAPVQLDSYSEKENTIGGSVGFGYHFNEWIRGEMNLGILPEDKYKAAGIIPDGCAGTTYTDATTYDPGGNQQGAPVLNSYADTTDCNATMSASNTNWTGTANAYLDLGTYAGFTPYVGGGLGLVYTKTKVNGSAVCGASSSTETDDFIDAPNRVTTVTSFLCDGQTNVNDDDVEYIGASSTDREYNLLYTLNAGVAYKVSQNASIDFGYQYVASPSAKHVSIDESGAVSMDEGFHYHQLKLGVRYDLW